VNDSEFPIEGAKGYTPNKFEIEKRKIALVSNIWCVIKKDTGTRTRAISKVCVTSTG
jgi:hypothetical protein